MALPSINVTVTNESFIVNTGEDSSTFLCGVMIPDTSEIISALGTTLEVQNAYMEIDSLEDWWSRLSARTGNGAGYSFGGFGGYVGNAAEADIIYDMQYPGFTEGVPIGITATQVRWPNGPTAPWESEFYTVESYCQYGGKSVIGMSSADPFTSINTHTLDGMFAASHGSSLDLGTALTARDNDCLGFFNVPHLGESITNSAETFGSPQECTGSNADASLVYVYGSKYTLPLGQNPNNITSDADYKEVPLSADAAGCMARTFRDAAPWYDPSGMIRGQILNVVKLKNPPTAAQANTLYDNIINPVLAFPGYGEVLFGNKVVGGSSGDFFGSRIGVASLIIYLKKQIGAYARNLLFERNDDSTRQVFINQSTSILETVKSQNGISDYNIVCDDTNNPTTTVNAGLFVADVFVKPYKSVEFLQISFTNAEQATDIT